MQTSYFHIVDKYSIPWVIVYAVSVASSYNTSMNTWDGHTLNRTVWRNCEIHLIWASADYCYWSMQAAIASINQYKERQQQTIMDIVQAYLC